MKLIVCTPLGAVLQTNITKVIMETLDGYHTLLPKHIDFASVMGPNIVSYTEESGAEKYIACHHGVVVKKGGEVTITVQNAVLSDTLDDLKNVISFEFKQNEEQRKELNTAMARLELGLIRGFGRLNKDSANG
ncbi:MAG: hypothetical protein VZR95_08540 [Alphaproteobacteria bacterium]